MKRTALSIMMIMLAASQILAYKQQSIDINVNGQKRNMVVFTPNSLPAKSPLFIVTHGMNQNPEYQYGADKMYEMIDTAKFVVTYLRSDGNTWDIGGTKDQTFVIKTIDEMAARFDIDKDRVYWSGFSMGSMLIHHCIANMQDKIAAFAPTSGIQFSESPWNNCKKPVNLLECIAYGDDVFGYEQYGIHAYIENYAKHDNHPNYSKTQHYKPISSSWYDGDLEKWTGGINGGEVWLYSYNNGGHWPMDLNRHLIWNFCKRFILNQPHVRITQPAGETTNVCMAPKGEAEFPDIEIRTTVKAPSGKIVKMDFYDGRTVIESKTASPWSTTITAPSSGKHSLRVEVVDNKDKTAQASCLVTNTASATSYNFTTAFNTEGIVPQGWQVSNGSTKRVGGGNAYTDGLRVLHFTNNSRAFEYGLLIQNNTGRAKASWCKFGGKAARSSLSLCPGHYALKYKLCNWDQPEFSPVTIAIEDRDGQEVASEIVTPSVNIGGNTGNKFARFSQKVFEFDIAEKNDYVIAFYADAVKNADFVLGQLTLQAVEFGTTAIMGIPDSPIQTSGQRTAVNADGRSFDISGRQLQPTQLKRGLYIINGRKTIVQ